MLEQMVSPLSPSLSLSLTILHNGKWKVSQVS